MTDWAPLDVAIGLALLYFLLAVFASAANEAIQATFNARGKYLERWLLNALKDPEGTEEEAKQRLAKFYDHSLVRPLMDQPERLRTKKTQKRRPSYLAPEVFSAVALGLHEGPTVGKSLDEVLEGIPSKTLADAVMRLRQNGDDLAKLRQRVERWYDDSMERVSGWYKRRVQLFIAVIGLVIVILVNADTISLVQRLWSERTVRAAVVAEADRIASTGSPTADLAKVADQVSKIQKLDVPLGWNFANDNPQGWPNGWRGWLAKVVGLLLTTLALTLGAPFWFDLLSKVARLRGSGAPPPATGATRRGEGEQTRAGPGVAS